MLKEFSFQNYRAFRRGSINIRPITILIGSNSVGKTAILQLPLLAKQTAALLDRRYESALKVHGKEVSFGGPGQIFHYMNTSDPVTIEFGFTSDRLLQQLQKQRIHEFINYLAEISQYILYISRESNIRTGDLFSHISSKDFFRYKDRISASDLSRYAKLIEDLSLALSKIPKDTLEKPVYSFLGRLSRTPSGKPRQLSPGTLSAELERILVLFAELSKIQSSLFKIEFKLGFFDSKEHGELLRAFQVTLRSRDRVILEIRTEDGRVTSIRSDFVAQKDIDVGHSKLSRMINMSGSIFRLFDSSGEEADRFDHAEVVRSLFSDALAALEREFGVSRIGHVGPLRAYPKRFYFVDTAYSGSEGDTLVESLRENSTLRKKVNDWLEKFQITIDVAQLEEIIYRLAVKRESHNFFLDITDVGFGISQVLPILVEGLLAPAGKTILIEQPEIHLHPQMQAELGDLFIDISGAGSAEGATRNLIVETHSEYLLKRLRRRIAERKIRHTDVGLYFVEPSDDGRGSVVRGVEIPADGNFEWPKGFYAQDLEDTLAFLESARKRSS